MDISVPYVWSEYELAPTMNRYKNSNEFDNVKNLTVCIKTIRDNSSCYFRHVESLRLINGCNFIDEYELLIKSLNMIINLSHIKKLTIDEERYMTPLLLLEILKELPSLSSLTIDKHSLVLFLNNNHQLCEYLNKNIKILDISNYWIESFIQSDKIDLFCKTFSNIEQFQCHIKNLDDLLLILTKCSKLLMINIGHTSEQIYSWIQINTSKLNVYIDFTSIHQEGEDDM